MCCGSSYVNVLSLNLLLSVLTLFSPWVLRAVHKRDIHTGASWQTLLVTGGCILYCLLQPDTELRV